MLFNPRDFYKVLLLQDSSGNILPDVPWTSSEGTSLQNMDFLLRA